MRLTDTAARGSGKDGRRVGQEGAAKGRGVPPTYQLWHISYGILVMAY